MAQDFAQLEIGRCGRIVEFKGYCNALLPPNKICYIYDDPAYSQSYGTFALSADVKLILVKML